MAFMKFKTSVCVVCMTFVASALAAMTKSPEYGAVLITEVMFDAKTSKSEDASTLKSKSSGDWIELYNPSANDAINITGWKFTDRSEKKVKAGKKTRGHVFVIPKFTLEPKTFAVLARDEVAFRDAYADRPEALEALVRGSFKFGLSLKGETISMLSRANETVFSLSYDDKNPWPSPDKGSSLEIIDVRLDPNDALSWIESYEIGGTPGAVNSNAVAWR
mmetsp:Transcript_1632/g.5908  ORF Transcript_1632/g.5908 Transcript_1632/m.5908 type:complete len:219 (-) Transcript_1632:51-707(-)